MDAYQHYIPLLRSLSVVSSLYLSAITVTLITTSMV